MRSLLPLLAAAGLVLAALPSRAVTIAIEPSAQTVTVGSPVSVALVVSGLGDGVAPSLSSFDLDLAFDPGVIAFVSAALGDQLSLTGLGSINGLTAGVGSVNLFETSLDAAGDLNALQAPSFTLATLQFQALGAGATALTISIVDLDDAVGAALPAEVVGASVTVVPEPGSFLLVLLGAMALSRPLRA